MNFNFLPFLLEGFADATSLGVDSIGIDTNTIGSMLPMNVPLFIIVGIVLIIATVFILFFLKKMIINSILGGVIWAIAVFVFQVQLPFIPSLVISIIIGPAGIGTMLLLKAFGLF